VSDIYVLIKVSDIVHQEGEGFGAALNLDTNKLIEIVKEQILGGTVVRLCDNHKDALFNPLPETPGMSNCAVCIAERDW
jgi:hypothetical protein